MRSALIFLMVLFFIFECTREDLVNPGASISAINLEIKFTDNQDNLSKINSPLKVAIVRVRVTGPDMAEITKNLTISGNRATGTLEIPKGPNRKFEVEGLDDQNNVLLRGEGTKDLNNDTESITILANWLQTSLNISVPVPRPYINLVTAFIEGDGLGGETHVEDLIIRKDENIASKTFDMPRGEKNIFILESVLSGQLIFEFYATSVVENLVSSTYNVNVPLDDRSDTKIEMEDTLRWHDYHYEQYVPAPGRISIDDIYAAGFDVSDIFPVFFKSIRIEWIRWDGNLGNYRIVILDGPDPDANARFISDPVNPADTPHPDNRIQWNILWYSPEAGIFNGTILAGIQFESDTGYPHIGYDTSNPSLSSYYYEASTNSWFFLNDGDFAISIVVQTPSGEQVELQPGRISDQNFMPKARMAISQ